MVKNMDSTIESENYQDAASSRFHSIKELMDYVNGRTIEDSSNSGDSGQAEHLPFPFLALVGQSEMKMALLLSLINPAIGGVLLIGPRGTGKTTAVRSLLSLLPNVVRSSCFYGCLPEDIETGGIDAVCPECAKKYGQGIPFTFIDQVHLVELPLNANLDDVIGSLDNRALVQNRLKFQRGLLAQADQNLMYIDEVNLLSDGIINAILDAAAQGIYTVRRGAISATYRARFTLIGSMNPEEGKLRPQILDRFGLRVMVQGLSTPSDRLEAYRRTRIFLNNPRQMINQYDEQTTLVSREIQKARSHLSTVNIPDSIARAGIELIKRMNIDSLRAEITLFESARAYAVADAREVVLLEDLRAVSKMCLRLRHSNFMDKYIAKFNQEDDNLQSILDQIVPPGDPSL